MNKITGIEVYAPLFRDDLGMMNGHEAGLTIYEVRRLCFMLRTADDHTKGVDWS
jgi:hypothetical protein